MTRIIAGLAGSLTLEVPGAGTRPTSDRVRESLFAALESWTSIDGARVLDLFAGSGALGLEAASRGASFVDLVERSRSAAATLQGNVRRIQPAVGGTPVRAHHTGADDFLRRTGTPYDLVFLDPPYDIGEDELARTLALVESRLAEDALVIVERSTRSPSPSAPAAWTLERSRRYGDTTLWWFSRG